MRTKMSKGAKKELLPSLQPQYRTAAWTQKQLLLDGFVAATGYDRKTNYAFTFIWDDVEIKEVRDSVGNIMSQFFTDLGQAISDSTLS